MPDSQSKATITNSAVAVPLSQLSEQELAALKSQASYKDSTVAYKLKNSGRWMKAPQLKALKEQLYVHLWRESEGNLILPQGLKYLLPNSAEFDDRRALPSLRKMIWHRSPKHELRYYQREAIDALLVDSRGQAVMATGSGKSLTILNLVREMGLKTLVICPSSLIANQLHKEFEEHLGPRVVGMYGSGKKQIKQVTVGLYQSITKNIEAFHDVELVVCDENQTLGAGSLMEITRGLGHVPYFYSVSATNYRADGRTLEIYAASGHVKYSFDTVRAIKEGWLAQPLFVMRDVPSAGGNYELKQKNYTDHVVKNETLNERIVKDARVMLDAHRSTLILVQEIEHGEILASKLNLPFANGENKDAMKLVEDLNRGKIKGLIAGAQMCGIGVDTVRVDCLIMASFPGTEGLTTQLIGRGLRKYEGKKMVVVLDYRVLGNNMLRRHADNRVEWYSKYGFVKEITVNAT